ncbi:MAG: hypothetical protein P9L88_00040 [Candidatus Tantalella remota]|nr:hypothetical protein [Candidatus Tantalella remota]
MKKIIILAAVVCILLTLQLNAQEGADVSGDDILQITGTVERFTFGGGFYGIQADDGKIYKPERLTMPFQREGLRVNATVRPKEKKFLIHGWGTPVYIIKIERVE